MIGTIIDLILGPLGSALGAVIGGIGLFLAGRSSGKKGAQNDALKDTQKRMEAGRDHVRKRRGDDPVDRVRSNDGRW